MKGSSFVSNILEDYFKGTRTIITETEDLKKKLAEKEAAFNELHVQDTVITGLQNDLETVRTQVKTLEGKLVIYTGLNNGLKADKEALQKQLELVTLRLPAPRVGFWARLFGKKNRNCQVTFHHSHKRMTPAADAGPFKN